MTVSDQLHAVAALRLRKTRRVPSGYDVGRWVGSRAGLGALELGKPLSLSGTEPRFLGRLTRNLVTKPTELHT